MNLFKHIMNFLICPSSAPNLHNSVVCAIYRSARLWLPVWPMVAVSKELSPYTRTKQYRQGHGEFVTQSLPQVGVGDTNLTQLRL